MQIDHALEFIRDKRNGILITLKSDGRPQSSNMLYRVGDDGVIRISVTASRAKSINLDRDPRASLHVNRDDFWAYVVIEGDVTQTPVAQHDRRRGRRPARRLLPLARGRTQGLGRVPPGPGRRGPPPGRTATRPTPTACSTADVTYGVRHQRDGQAFLGSSLNGTTRSWFGSLGRPRTRSPMMLRCTWSVPP